MTRSLVLLTATLTTLALAACEQSSDQVITDPNRPSPTDTIDPTDTSLGTDDTDTGPNPTDTGYESSSDPKNTSSVCDTAGFQIEAVPVRLMVLLDRSLSMAEGEPTKWDQARSALQEMFASNGDGTIEFGFDAFPDDGWCGVEDTLIADCEPGSIAAIETTLAAMEVPTSGQTPLCRAMHRFTNPKYAPKFLSDDAQSYLLVISDGDDSCQGPPTSPCGSFLSEPNFAALTRTLRDDHDVRTFVIGFGDGATAKLNNIAKEGGTPFTQYIPAANQAELQAALDTIAGTVVSCTFEVGEPNASADPDQVNVFFDDTNIGYDEGCALDKGWNWSDAEHTLIELCDASCETLRSGTVSNVRAEFGCPSVPVY